MSILSQKFDSLIEIVGSHHIYTGPNKAGYGRVYIGRYEGAKKYRMPAHIFALYRLGIEIPDNAIVCHHCDVPPCVNPEHLYLGNRSTNAEDFWNRLVTNEYREKLRKAPAIYWRTH